MGKFFRFDNLDRVPGVTPQLLKDYVRAPGAVAEDRFHQLFWTNLLWGDYLSGEFGSAEAFLRDLSSILPAGESTVLFGLLARESLVKTPIGKKTGGPYGHPQNVTKAVQAIARLVKEDTPEELTDNRLKKEVRTQVKLMGAGKLLPSDMTRLLGLRKETRRDPE